MHKCVRCGKEFDHLSDDLLKGCPECGGKLFLYVRDNSPFADDIKSIETIEATEEELKALENLSELEEQGEQIEGLRILSPGVYELNLATLLQQDGIILKLKSEGKYAIHLPSLFERRRKKRHD